MTTMQPILALRHVYEPAVQLCRTDGVVSAMANSTLGSPPHHLLRKGECAGLESRSNPSSPTFSQGKVQLPPPPQPNLEYRQLLEGSDSEAKAFRENARSYNNAFSFTSLAAHWDQTQVGTLGPPVFRVFSRLYHRLGALIPTVTQRPAFAQTWLIDPAEATDTRLGPDGADSRMQRSTLTKVESILRTGNRFVREFASAKAHAGWDTAKEWILRLCLPPGRDRRTHNLPTSSTEMAMLICDSDTNTGDRGRQDLILQVHGDRCPEGRPKYQVVSSLHPSAMPLRYPLLFPAGEDGFHPNIPRCGFHQAGPPIARNREQIDNGANCASYLPVSVWMTKRMVMVNDEGQVKGSRSRWRVSRSQFFTTCQRRRVVLNPALHPTSLPGVSIPGCDGVRCQPWKASAAHHDDVRLRLTGNQGCTGADTACNRPDLIARVFEAKSSNKRHAGCFGDEYKMNGFCFFANRGLYTELNNYRAVCFGLILAILATSWFTTLAQEYAMRRHLIPETQTAVQSGNQQRDLTSYLSQIQAWAYRHDETIYALVRDQKKSFDLLRAEAGYDAYNFFGLPKAVEDFDRARLAQGRFFVKTPYGPTEPFTAEAG
ncbi:BQ5605_C003g02079 [Microbotryum silenes-dioicae]|uniref:BQ5605_C003g02079 protein n=1 Tax=Microbotryum silenes-dioicae TaxID=796604 RepID=A0A2X0MV97_9BASI|nr:BQ5605_C003g02079 [Microbotryum silenes-dioicae]